MTYFFLTVAEGTNGPLGIPRVLVIRPGLRASLSRFRSNANCSLLGLGLGGVQAPVPMATAMRMVQCSRKVGPSPSYCRPVGINTCAMDK